MTTKNKFTKRIISMLLIFCLTFTYLPFAVESNAATGGTYQKTVDASRLDGWKAYFGPDVMNTANAGGVWTDKSVFTDASAFPANTVELSDPNNFIVALSAIAANKEIVGYSTIPTDTVLVLDVSGSMKDDASALVSAANEAIKKLYETNNNNRVGVVLYSGNSDFGTSTYAQGVTTVLPLDRYTSESGSFLRYNDGAVSVNSGVTASGGGIVSGSKAVSGSTYIQAGLYEAMLQFEAADTLIGSNNFQSGQKRMPILVLMSDGAPTTATNNYDQVNKKYNVGRPPVQTDRSTAGDGGSDNATNSMGFLTQLTASYVMSKIEAHYDYAGEGLFYSLGMGVGEDAVAMSVLDPANSTNSIDKYWEDYLELDSTNSMVLSVPDTDGNGTKSVSVSRNSYVTEQNYVDETFYASDGSDLVNAFQKLVDEIILQSRYYATDIEGGNPDFSGYLTFEDRIGEYMEVKNVYGFFLGDTYYDGSLLASTLGSLGSIETPTELGWEFIDSVKTRLGITEQTAAITLIENAYRYGQLSYSVEQGTGKVSFSNYIGWYAYADGSYAGFWQEGVTTPPTGAVYKVKSYGFLGEAKGNIKDSDMMYMTVRVAESIATGAHTVHWKIPAALVPMVTYKITVDGYSVETAKNVQLVREEAEPIRLVFETGLKSHINSLNVSEITDTKNVMSDGARVFWTNKFDKTSSNHEDHLATQVFYTPSEENERYYYTTDAVVHTKNGSEYTEVPSAQTLDPDVTYYHSRYIFTSDSTVPQYLWEPIAKASLAKAVDKDGVWTIPVGTVFRYMEDVRQLKDENITNSIDYYNYPYLRATNTTLDVEQNLGNNGQLKIYPATAIAITKKVDVVEPGTSTTFDFRITLKDSTGAAVNGSFGTVLADAGETTGVEDTLTFVDGVLQTSIDMDKTLYILGLSAGMSYTVEEIFTTSNYKVKTVHVNGTYVAGDTATGTVTLQKVDKIDFLNTPTTDGNLYITKRVEHPYGDSYTLSDKNLSFEITIALTYGGAPLANQSYTYVNGGTSNITTDGQGKLTFTLAPNETVAIHGIPETTQYTVTEREIAGDGFTLSTQKSTGLIGEISPTSNAHATLVNVYSPAEISPDNNEIVLELTKSLEGRDWLNTDSFEFVIEKLHPETLEPTETIGTVTINNKNELTKLFDLTDEVYTEVGTYHYRITEAAGNGKNGIAYDNQIRRFHVTVTDEDMDGYLEIADVENVARTTVSVDSNLDYTVAAVFTNTYAAYQGTAVEIPVQKIIADNNFSLNGFKFGIWDESGENLIYESAITDTLGKTSINLAFSATDIGVHKYLLAEIEGNINGMTYSNEVYSVTITISDNFDGTVSAVYEIRDAVGELVSTAPTFTNDYEPTEAQLVLSGKKILDGRILNEGEFDFNLYKTDSTYSIDGHAPYESVSNASNGSFIFSTLVFENVGEYYFVINETQGTLGGVTYSEQSYNIKVTVTDNNGTLEVATDLVGDITFTNVYDATDVNVNISGTKVLSGRDLADGEFEFVLREEDGTVKDTKKNENGVFSFDTISYDTAGTYIYTVEESAGTLGGITYDSSVYTVTVKVIDDGTGKLQAQVSYEKDGVEANSIVFRNTYIAAPYVIEVEGVKSLSGRALREGEFTFILTGGKSGTELERVTNAADKTFSFTGLTVYKANTYRLKLTELKGGLGGVNYDMSIYDITVVVSDDGVGNLYESERTVTRNGLPYNEEIKFENTYSVADAKLTLGGKKILENRELNADEFSFTLYDTKLVGDIPQKNGGAKETVKNAADGSFTFSEITYSDEGTYYYIVEEVEGSLGGITYDMTVYTVKVVVTDNLDGTFGVETTYEDGDGAADSVVFTNKYKAASVAHTIDGIKKLNGRELISEEFSFKLYNAKLEGDRIKIDGAAKETVKNAANGSFSFSEMTFSEIGTYYYIVEEDTSAAATGITYDKTVYYITVEVTDDGDGQLDKEVSIESSLKGAVDSIAFVNTYTTPDNPDTGDRGNFILLFALVIAGSGIVATLASGKKKEQE